MGRCDCCCQNCRVQWHSDNGIGPSIEKTRVPILCCHAESKASLFIQRCTSSLGCM